MAVTLTVEHLAHALRITPSPTTALTTEQTVTLARLLGAASSMVLNYAALSPDDVANEAVIRLAGWMHDQPPGRQNADALGLSGARSMLGPWRTRRALGVGDGEDSGTLSGNGLSEAEVRAIVESLIADLNPFPLGIEITRYGYSDDAIISADEIVYVAVGTAVTLVNPPELAHLILWRSDADGGDFTDADLIDTLARSAFSDAVPITLYGVPGQAIISNAALRLREVG